MGEQDKNNDLSNGPAGEESSNFARGFDESAPVEEDASRDVEPMESTSAQEDVSKDAEPVESEPVTVSRGFDQIEEAPLSQDEDAGEKDEDKSPELNTDENKEAWFAKLNNDNDKEDKPAPVTATIPETHEEENKNSEKDIAIEKYLTSIGKSKDVRTEDYDPNLVKYEDNEIKDYNEIGVILKDVGKYYGIIIALIIGLFLSMAIFGQYVLGMVLVCILIFIMLVIVVLLIAGFYENIRSTRDIQHKLVVSTYVLPLVIIFAYFALTIGLMETLMAIGALIAIGIVGLVLIFVCGLFGGKK